MENTNITQGYCKDTKCAFDVYTKKFIDENIITDMNELEHKIVGLSDGSPKGYYATVSELENANPEAGTYIITEDGHLYSWIKSKNLLDINATPHTTFYSSPTVNGDTLSTSGQSENFVTYLINVNPNTDYTFSVESMTGEVNIYDETVMIPIYGTEKDGIININTGSFEQITVVFYGNGNYVKPQFEDGNSATKYTQYKAYAVDLGIYQVAGTDNSLTKEGIPADAKAVGDKFKEIGSDLIANYENLENKPSINDVELVGNKTLDELGIQAKGDYATETYVKNQILAAQLEGAEVDLSGYVTQDEMKDYASKEDLNDFITEEEVIEVVNKAIGTALGGSY